MTAATLKKIRLNTNLSQRNLVELLDVDPTTVRRWEQDKTKIPRSVEIEFIQILDTLHAIGSESCDRKKHS